MDKKVFVISGGSRGLGAVITKALLDDGHSVCTFSRSPSDFVKEHESNPNFFWQKVDSLDQGELKSFMNAVLDRHDEIYGLINNAGIGTEGLLATSRLSDLEATIDVNLKSALILTRLAIKNMMRSKQGIVINISSINGVRGHSGLSAYSASKAGLDGMTRSLAREVGRNGIRVNSISPGYFESDMVGHMSEKVLERICRRTPLGRLGKMKDISNLVNYLIKDGQFITGQNIVIDGGITC